MLKAVDEVWAYTGYVKGVYVRSGMPAERVHIVPPGVDITLFHPERPPLALRTKKRFKFLFVGGTIARKGFDVLLAAYLAAFRRQDDVCLVIKDMGGSSYYEGQTTQARIALHQAHPAAPEIEYLDDCLSTEQMAGLYRACDCLVHPYRGEGFGLPMAEAMASGLPVIVTGMGAAMDYCNADNAFLIPARRRYFADKRVGDEETVDVPWVAEPDARALCRLLHHVLEHPEERRGKARAGCEHIRAHFRWDQAVDAAERRLLALRGMPIRRFAKGTTNNTNCTNK
jgi:glycosyltransferase involved in cell wall biosynthesis